MELFGLKVYSYDNILDLRIANNKDLLLQNEVHLAQEEGVNKHYS